MFTLCYIRLHLCRLKKKFLFDLEWLSCHVVRRSYDLSSRATFKNWEKHPDNLQEASRNFCPKKWILPRIWVGLEEDLKLQMKIEPTDTFVLAMKCWAEDPVKVILELAIPLYSQVPFKRMRLWRLCIPWAKNLGVF